MRNLLALVAAAVITFLGLGYYLDWYQISSSSTTAGRRQVNIDLNTSKIGADFEKGGKKVKQILDKKDKKEDTEKKDSAPAKDSSTPPEPEKKDSLDDGTKQ